jgi:hypothetical protein
VALRPKHVPNAEGSVPDRRPRPHASAGTAAAGSPAAAPAWRSLPLPAVRSPPQCAAATTDPTRTTPLQSVTRLVRLAVRRQRSQENSCVPATADRPGISATSSNTAAEHLHRKAALLADVAKQPPAAGAPRKQRQPAAAGHREVPAVGAERSVPERPVGCQVRCRRPQVVHLRRQNPTVRLLSFEL